MKTYKNNPDYQSIWGCTLEPADQQGKNDILTKCKSHKVLFYRSILVHLFKNSKTVSNNYDI